MSNKIEKLKYFKAYDSSSKIALFLYVMMITSRILMHALPDMNSALMTAIVIVFWGTLIGYVIYFIKAFISQDKYAKLIGKDNFGLGLNANLYLIIGPAFFLIMFFIFRKQIKDLQTTS
jgi:hypothetical protein